MIRVLGLIVAAACLAFGLGQPAVAQPAGAIAFAPLSAGLTVDGVHFSVSDSSVGWDGNSYTGATACNVGGVCLYMAPGSGPEPSIVIEAAIGSTLVPIDSYTCTTSSPDYISGYGLCVNSSYDLSANVTAKVLSGTPLTGASVTLAASAPAGQAAMVYITEGLSGAPGCTTGLYADGDAPTASCTFSSPSTSVTGDKDAGLGPGFMPSATPYAMMTITEGFTRIPEPASIACLLFGVIALAAARRSTRQA